MHTITINGQRISLERPVTLLEAALSNGIDIPHLCDHPMLEKHGACRICLVSVKGMPRLMPSCITMTENSMVIETETQEVVKARRGVVELMLINHPLECPSCEKTSICRLQDYAFKYGASTGRFKEIKLGKDSPLQDPLIRQNRSRCILCTRCVRMCDGVQGIGALALVGRGNKAAIEHFAGHTLDCEYCGNCISVCPVGALTSKNHFTGGRPWDTEHKALSSCPHCGLGCRVEVEYGKNRIQKVSPKGDAGILCARGSFGYDFITSPERLSSPLVRQEGELREATWEEALARVAKGLMNIRHTYGGRSIAAMASPLCGNEDNYMLQRFMRMALDSPNIDSTVRIGLAASRPLVEGLLGHGAGATAISFIDESDAIIVVGGDPVSEMPVLGVKVRQAHRRGTPVVAFGRTPGLARYTSYLIDAAPGRQWPLLEALTRILIHKRGLPGTSPIIEGEIGKLELPDTTQLQDTHFVEDIECISRMLDDKKTITIIVGRDAAANEHGARNLLVTSALCHVLGARMILCSELLNENGLIDMGCLPDHLPGGASTLDEDAWSRLERAMGFGEGFTQHLKDALSEGLSLAEFFQSAISGDIKAMFVMGANPAASLPFSSFMREALESLDMLVVQDIMLTETAKMADVVLPASAWTERETTYTDASLRVRHTPALIKSKARPDWRILRDLTALCGVPMRAECSEDIMDEISRAVPAYRSASYHAFNNSEFRAIEGKEAAHTASLPDLSEYYTIPVPSKDTLIVDSSIFSFGTLGLLSLSLDSVRKAPTIQLNESTAERLGLKPRSKAKVSTDQGSIIVEVVITSSVGDGSIALVNADGMIELNEMTRYGVSRLTRALFPLYQNLKITPWDRRGTQQRRASVKPAHGD